jgi:hypothetical protein
MCAIMMDWAVRESHLCRLLGIVHGRELDCAACECKCESYLSLKFYKEVGA